MGKFKLSVPSWLVYIDEDGKYQAEDEWNGEFTREELEFMGYEILGNPAAGRKIDAIQWVIDCQSKF